MRAEVWLLLLASAACLRAAGADEGFGLAVQRNLDRAYQLYPAAAVPGHPLSQAMLYRIAWLNKNNPAFYSDPEWPVRVVTAEAARLGIHAQQPRSAVRPSAVASADGPRYLAVVTRSFNVGGVSFKKGRQLIIEALKDYRKRGIVMIDGQPVTLWLDNIKLLRELGPNEVSPLLVKIVSARYGLAGTKGYVVTSAVQAALVQNSAGVPQLLVTDSLLSAAAVDRLNRSAVSQRTDPVTGISSPVVTPKVLSVVYETGGEEKTRQAQEGEVLSLD